MQWLFRIVKIVGNANAKQFMKICQTNALPTPLFDVFQNNNNKQTKNGRCTVVTYGVHDLHANHIENHLFIAVNFYVMLYKYIDIYIYVRWMIKLNTRYFYFDMNADMLLYKYIYSHTNNVIKKMMTMHHRKQKTQWQIQILAFSLYDKMYHQSFKQY